MSFSRRMAWSLFAAFTFSATLLSAPAGETMVTDCYMDGNSHFIVQAEVPAGATFAALETSTAGTDWRTALATALDGRRGRVTFRLPRDPALVRSIARVRTGLGAPPAADVPGAAWITVFYDPQIISEQARIDLLNAAGVKMREWRELPPAQHTANLIAWAKTSPLVADAAASTLSPTAVFVQFRDGEVCTLYRRRRVEEPIGAAVPPSPRRAGRSAGQGAAAAEPGLPDTANAICAYSLESHIFPSSAPTVAGWLSRANYQTRTFASTSVEDILSWSAAEPIGVLFWQAHGAPYKVDGNLGGMEAISIVTRHKATATGRLGKFSAAIRRGELALAKDDSETEPCYTITSRFVRNNMRFAPHSLVMLDVCLGAHTELTDAFVDSGAGAVASWDVLSGIDSAVPMLKVFDRLLGTNAEPPVSYPPERPFALPVIRQWMFLRGYDVDPSPRYKDQTDFNARLLWNMNPRKPADILRPSIMRVLYEGADTGEQFTKLSIEGSFGTDPGASRRRLTWAGQPVSILHWKPDAITIRMPDGKPAGSFMVAIDRVHISNERPFTEWTIPFTSTHRDRGSLTYTLSMKVKMRADIAGTRGMPEMPAQYLPVNFWNHTDCDGSMSATGSYSPDPQTTIVWSGGSPLRSLDPQTPGSELATNAIRNSGQINLMTGLIANYQLMGSGEFTESETDKTPRHVAGGALLFLYPPLIPRLNLGNSAIIGDDLSMVLPDGGGSEHASWPTVLPKAAPTPQTPR